MADDVTGGSGGEGDGWTEVPRVNHLSELNEDSECTEASPGPNYAWLVDHCSMDDAYCCGVVVQTLPFSIVKHSALLSAV